MSAPAIAWSVLLHEAEHVAMALTVGVVPTVARVGGTKKHPNGSMDGYVHLPEPARGQVADLLISLAAPIADGVDVTGWPIDPATWGGSSADGERVARIVDELGLDEEEYVEVVELAGRAMDGPRYQARRSAVIEAFGEHEFVLDCRRAAQDRRGRMVTQRYG